VLLNSSFVSDAAMRDILGGFHRMQESAGNVFYCSGKKAQLRKAILWNRSSRMSDVFSGGLVQMFDVARASNHHSRADELRQLSLTSFFQRRRIRCAFCFAFIDTNEPVYDGVRSCERHFQLALRIASAYLRSEVSA